MKSPELSKVDIWGTFPSSSGNLNQELEELKERCRYLTDKPMKNPLFIRHKPLSKRHHTPHETRLSEGCVKHFNSVILNPYYRNRVKDKTGCVIDDYVTNSISFETARSLLLKAVQRVLFYLH